MSVVNRQGVKQILHKTGRDPFWEMIHQAIEGKGRCDWESVAMLCLNQECGWPMAIISRAFRGIDKGNVSRRITTIKAHLVEVLKLEKDNTEETFFEFKADDLESDPAPV